MNAFHEHHQDSIRFGYRCFDRLLLNGLIQPFQQPERVIGFFNSYRQQYPVSRDVLREIASQFHNWAVNRSQKWGAPILEAPEDRRDKFLDPYFRKAKPNQVVAIVKGREPARIMIAIGNDYGCNKAVENLPQLRQSMSSVIDNYHNVQQDILETFIDRGQLRKLAAPTVLPNGKRIPGLKLDHPRQLALMHSLVRFSHIAAQSTFTTSEIYADTVAALEVSEKDYRLASLRYDLSKLRAKGLVERVPRSRRYRLLRDGYSVCLVFLKLFERIYAPLTAGLLSPVSTDSKLHQQKRSQLDRLYQRVIDDLDKLMDAVGLKAA
jgi:hypothetical protein